MTELAGQTATLAGKTAVVVGASKGFGRGVAEAFASSGCRVVAVARASGALDELAAAHPEFEVEAIDATNAAEAVKIIARYRPDLLALVAGARPELRPVHQHTWETFSVSWETDVRLTFAWIRESLLLPLRPGSLVIAMSSAAALRGSPMSGSYAGAKATIRFVASYADDESARTGLGIRVVAVLPALTPATELGLQAVAAYAGREGLDQEAFIQRLGNPVTPEAVGRGFVAMATGAMGELASAYVMTGEGLQPLP